MSSDPLDHRPAAPFVWLPVWLSVLIHVGAWMMFGHWMAFRVPFSEQIFADFGVQPSDASIVVMRLSNLLRSVWIVPLLLLGIVLGGDFVVDSWLARHERYQLRLWWFLAGLFVPLGAMFFVMATLDLMWFFEWL